jgi:hypothetical protein
MKNQILEQNEAQEFDFYLRWQWPADIEKCLRQSLWLSLVEYSEFQAVFHMHTAALRWQIATSKESPSMVLAYLSSLDDPALLSQIATNPQTAAFTLAQLANSKHAAVRIAVASNSNTSIEVLYLLVKDESLDVRFNMAQNCLLPDKVLQKLKDDTSPGIADRAGRSLKLNQQSRARAS